ncbi:hypothetical protein EDC04DRAFT_2609810 [Pisolithus marmoratus]|nr:hypothetical protein EDC04DRAFT_2609810 [Pisolithus marmoratus]
MSQVPHGWQMQLTDKVAKYMQSRFWEEVFAGQCAIPDISIPVPLTCDITASLGYDEIMAPTMVLDGNGNIRLWLLPGALNHIHQVPTGEKHKEIMQVWLEKGPGTILQNSRTHGKYRPLTSMVSARQPPDFHPEVSKLLKSGEESNSAQQWVNQMSEVHALLSRTLAVIHPQMYSVGWGALIQLDMKAKQQEDADMSSILPSWNAIYNNINGWEQWLDMLLMVGDYPPLDFIIPTFKLCFHYNPGTIIAMSGSALEHGVGYTMDIVKNHKTNLSVFLEA